MTNCFVSDVNVNLGTLGAVLGKNMGGDNYLPDWLEEGVNTALRDVEEDAPMAPTILSLSSASSGPMSFTSSRGSPIVLTPTGPSPSGSYVPQESGKSPWTDLDKFYEESSEEEDEGGEEDEGEEEEEDDEGDGEEGEEVGEEGSGGMEHDAESDGGEGSSDEDDEDEKADESQTLQRKQR